MVTELTLHGLKLEEEGERVPYLIITNDGQIDQQVTDFLRMARRVRLQLDDDHVLLAMARIVQEGDQMVLLYAECLGEQEHIQTGWS